MGGTRNVWLSFVFIAIGGLLFGYIIGITSNIITRGQLECASTWAGNVGTWTSQGYRQCYELSAWDEGIIASLNLLGATVSSLFCFRFGDSIGRKRELQIGGVLYFLGAAVTAGVPFRWAVYLGLLIYGLGIGFAMHAAPVYIAEISPAQMRGMMVSAKELVIVFGIFFGFFAGWAFGSYEQVGWRYMISLAGIFALILEVGMLFVHRSPRWLVLQAVRRGGLLGPEGSYMEEARAALQFFRQAAAEEVEEELQRIHSDAAASVGEGPVRMCDACRYPRPLGVGCTLVLLQQVTGQPAVLYFATNILKGAGFSSDAAVSSVAVGFVKLLATFFTVSRVDQFGRRTLLMVGIMLMVLALSMLSLGFFFRSCKLSGTSVADCPQEQLELPRGWALLTVAGLMFYVSGYQVGFGPISWLMISEIFPLGVRGAALSTAAMVNFSSNVLVNAVQSALMKLLTPSGLFLVYLGLSLVSLLFVSRCVPETKGKTLEEIEREMTAGRRREGVSEIAKRPQATA